MNVISATVPTSIAIMPDLPDRIGAKVRADRAFLDHTQIHRQGARAQRDGQLVGASTVKPPEICADAAKDRFIDVGRGQDLAVQE